jgi:hypothetical protein
MRRRPWIRRAATTLGLIVASFGVLFGVPLAAMADISPTEFQQFSGTVGSYPAICTYDPEFKDWSCAGGGNATVTWSDNTSSAGLDNTTGTCEGKTRPTSCRIEVVGTHTYGEAGTYAGSWSDDIGKSGTFTANVVDAPLTFASFSSSPAIVEGNTFSGQVASFSDGYAAAPASDYTAVISWGDGQTSSGTVGGGNPHAVTGSHFYAEACACRVSVTVHDVDGNTVTDDGTGGNVAPQTTANVVDAPLTFASFSSSPAIVEGNTFSGQVASFSDGYAAATASDYTAVINWGDGQTSSGTVSAGNPHAVTGSHFYAEACTCRVSVTVHDVDGNTVTDDGAGGDVGPQTTIKVAANPTGGPGGPALSIPAGAVCPVGSAANGENCLGGIALPTGCVRAGDRLKVAVPAARNVVSVRYTIDRRPRWVAGRGRRFVASLSTSGLATGKHHLTARIRFRSGRPRTLSKTRTFAIC